MINTVALTRSLLLQSITNRELIDQSTLNNIIKGENYEEPFSSLLNLVIESNVSFNSIESALNYCTYLVQLYSSTINYNEQEIQILSFYLFLRADKHTKYDPSHIIKLYKSLPTISNQSLLMKWIEYQIKLWILPYFFLNNSSEAEIKLLLHQIDSYSQRVRTYI